MTERPEKAELCESQCPGTRNTDVSLPGGRPENISQAESQFNLPLPFGVDRPSTDCMSPTHVGEGRGFYWVH